MRALKSLKAFKYFDGYVQNVWAIEVDQESDLLVIRCYCFSSLKSGTMYPVFASATVVMSTQLNATVLQVESSM